MEVGSSIPSPRARMYSQKWAFRQRLHLCWWWYFLSQDPRSFTLWMSHRIPPWFLPLSSGQVSSSFILHVHKDRWAKDPQVRHIWFTSMPEFKRCYFSSAGYCPVLDIRCTGVRTARTQSSRETFFLNIWLRADSSIVLYSFGYPVQLRCVGRRDLMSNPIFCQPVFKILTGKLATSVGSKDLCCLSSLKLHLRIEFIEGFLPLWLVLPQLDVTKAWKIILEGHKVSCPAWWAYMKRATHIIVDNITNLSSFGASWLKSITWRLP